MQPLFDSLERSGFVVDVATDRQCAVDLSERNVYDVALLDDQVQRDNGIDIYRDIGRRQGRVDSILCCHDMTSECVDAAIAAGVSHVVGKELRAIDLAPLVRGAVTESSRSFDDRFPDAAPGWVTEEEMVKSRAGTL